VPTTEISQLQQQQALQRRAAKGVSSKLRERRASGSGGAPAAERRGALHPTHWPALAYDFGQWWACVCRVTAGAALGGSSARSASGAPQRTSWTAALAAAHQEWLQEVDATCGATPWPYLYAADSPTAASLRPMLLCLFVSLLAFGFALAALLLQWLCERGQRQGVAAAAARAG
jgi:hypothetical protein